MKRICMLSYIFILLILFAGCSTEKVDSKADRVLDEIVLDGENTYVVGINAGMSVDEVLKALSLTEEDVTIDTANIPGVSTYTSMFTEDIYQYDEFSTELAFRKMFVFHDGKLKSMTYNSYIDHSDLSESYDIAMDFMNCFIEKTGAKPMETGTEFEYQTYGSPEKDSFLNPGGKYVCQFFHGGVLGEIGMSSFTPTADQGYGQDVMVQLGISLMLDRAAQ